MKTELMEQELKRLVKKDELDEQMFDLLLRDSETSMKLHLEQEEDYSRLGNSRIAGYPDLPPSIAWPCTEDDEHYTFLAQINLGEMPFSPVEGMPNEGMLYFFLGLDEPAYDIEHQVYYYNGDMSLLKKTLPPEGKVEVVEERRGFVPYRVQLLPQLNVISDSEAYETLLDEYSDSLAYATLCDGSDAIWGQHQSFAGDTPMDAYLCRNGMKDLLFNTYKTVERVREEAKQAMERGSETYSEHLISDVLPQLEQFLARKEEHEQASKNWHVLFSLSSLDEVGMCWWDAGYLEFYMDKEDLKQLNFSNTYVNLATS